MGYNHTRYNTNLRSKKPSSILTSEGPVYWTRAATIIRWPCNLSRFCVAKDARTDQNLRQLVPLHLPSKLQFRVRGPSCIRVKDNQITGLSGFASGDILTTGRCPSTRKYLLLAFLAWPGYRFPILSPPLVPVSAWTD